MSIPGAVHSGDHRFPNPIDNGDRLINHVRLTDDLIAFLKACGHFHKVLSRWFNIDLSAFNRVVRHGHVANLGAILHLDGAGWNDQGLGVVPGFNLDLGSHSRHHPFRGIDQLDDGQEILDVISCSGARWGEGQGRNRHHLALKLLIGHRFQADQRRHSRGDLAQE